MSSEWDGKRVAITGVCGTVGKALLKIMAETGASEIIGLDNNESELFFIQQEYRADPRIRVFTSDIRDRDGLRRRFDGADVVLHSAALKHVILNEHSPREAIQTNIHGTQNVIDAALESGVKHVLFTSSDKAVNPTNVMGTSKLMGERLMTAANADRQGMETIFASTRFGNVLGSRGSVIPIFRRQIAQGGPVTVTEEDMTRFIMTLEGAADLVVKSTFLAKGGEVFVTKMPVVRIIDLAQVMIEELAPVYGHKAEDITIDIIGAKPGEKLYEELITDEEVRRVIELPNYYVVTPAFHSVYRNVNYGYEGMVTTKVQEPYNSSVAPAMSIEEIRAYLIQNKLLEDVE